MSVGSVRLNEAREILLQAVLRQANSPVGRSGVEPMAMRLDEVGEKQFLTIYRNKPPERAIAEMLAASSAEGLWNDPDNKPSPGTTMNVDRARFEAVLAIAESGDMSHVPVSDADDFLRLVSALAADGQDEPDNYFSRLEGHVLALPERHKPQVTVSENGVCMRAFKPEDEAGMSAFNEDLNNNWELAATSTDGTARLYVDEHDKGGLTIRCVSDIGAGMLGQTVFTSFGSQKIDGAYLTSVGMFPSVTDLSTPAPSERDYLVSKLRDVLDEYGMDDMLPMPGMSAEVTEMVDSCISEASSNQPSPGGSLLRQNAPEM